jgi:outer membrane receptor for ferrienterochelin and colicins
MGERRELAMEKLKLVNALSALLFFIIFTSVAMAAEEPNLEQPQEDLGVYQLDPVVVTGTRSPHMLKDVPIETSVITRQEMERAGIQNVEEALRWIPGINISGGALNGAAGRTTAILRGLPAQYSLILVDGRRIKSEHIHTGLNLNLIPVEMVERIEIVKGPASVLYGSEALGGVVNIITKSAPEKPTLDVKYSYGSFKTQNNFYSYGARDGNLGYFLAGKLSSTDGADFGLGFRQKNTLARITYDLTKQDTLKFDMGYYENKYDASGHDIKDESTDFVGGWEHRFEDGGSLNVGGYITRFTASKKNTTNIISLGDVVYQKEIFENHLITAGLEIRHEDFEREASPHKTECIVSLYAQDEWKLTDFLSTVLGIRMDDHPSVGTVVTPKAALLYELSDATKLRATIARGFRAPTLQDRYEYHFFHDTYFRDGNPDLDPEYSTSYNLGVEHLFNQSLLGRVSLFRNDFKNMITEVDTGVDDGGFDVFERQNIKKARTQGVESELRYSIKDLDIIFGYTFLDTEDDEGKVLSYNPKHLFSGRLYYDMKEAGLGFMLSFENALSRSFQNKSGLTQKLSDYILMNFNVTKEISKNVSIFFTIGNILDKRFFVYEEGSAEAAFGRTFNVGINALF